MKTTKAQRLCAAVIIGLLLTSIPIRPSGAEESNPTPPHPLPNSPALQVMALRQSIEALEADKEPALELRELAGLECDFQPEVSKSEFSKEPCLSLAQFHLGFHTLVGRGVEVDIAQGVASYTRAAESGLVQAQYALALLYDEGDLVPQDNFKALFWYDKAAHQGHIQAQTNLGSMYQWGRGVPPSPRLAGDWFLKAARQGSHTAQWNLGILYLGGHGLPEDPRLALFWLRAGALNGEPRATFLANKLEEAYRQCFEIKTSSACEFSLTANEREQLTVPQNQDLAPGKEAE